MHRVQETRHTEPVGFVVPLSRACSIFARTTCERLSSVKVYAMATQTEAIMATFTTKQVLEKTAQQTVRLALRVRLVE